MHPDVHLRRLDMVHSVWFTLDMETNQITTGAIATPTHSDRAGAYWAAHYAAQAAAAKTDPTICPNCLGPIGDACYYCCPNSPLYYSPEQEKEDALASEAMGYDAWYSSARAAEAGAFDFLDDGYAAGFDPDSLTDNELLAHMALGRS